MKNNFGHIMQHGYVVPSLEAAIPQWAGIGVGPFFVGDVFTIEEYFYRGAIKPCSLRIANGYWGDIQIELVEPVGDAVTMYSDFLRDGKGPLNHFATMVPDVDAVIEQHGLQSHIVQWGNTIGGRFAYLDGLLPNGLYLELIEDHPLLKNGNAAMALAAVDWDGTRPHRSRKELVQNP